MTIAEIFPETKVPTQAEPPKVRYTTVTSDRPLSKRFTDVDGRPSKLASDATLASGMAESFLLKGDAHSMAKALAADLEHLGVNQAIICAPPPSGQKSWRLVTEAMLKDNPGAIARTKENFAPPAGPALFTFDIDRKDFAPSIKEQLPDDSALFAALASVCPELSQAAAVWRRSMSCGVRHKATGHQTPRDAGLHVFHFIPDGRDASRFAKTVRDRLVLAGYGWGQVTAAGHVSIKTLIDLSASSDTSRLSYEGQAILESDTLEIVPDARKPVVRVGGFLDTSSLPDLTEEERADLRRIESDIRAQHADEAELARLAHKQRTRATIKLDKRDHSDFEADHSRAVDDFTLQGDFPIHLDDGRWVSAREVAANPHKFDGLTCSDPLEPEYHGGRNIGIIYTGGGSIRIESQAHGGVTYPIRLKVADFWVDPAELQAKEEAEKTHAVPTSGPQDPFGHGPTEGLLALPAGAFPAVIENWAKDTGERMGVPPVYSAISALATVAGAIGNKLWIQPKISDTGWQEPSILWVLTAEDVGGLKTPSMDAATKPLRDVDHQNAKEGARRLEQWETEKKLAKGKDAILALPPEPKIKRNVVGDITTEALGAVLAHNRSVLIYQDEITGLFGALDAYKTSKGGDRPKILKLFNGASDRVDRVGRKHIPIDFWGASLIGGIQPAKFREISGTLDADGLLQRFLPILGDGRAQFREEIDRAPDAAAEAAYFSFVKKCALATDTKAVVKLTEEAYVIMKSVRDRIRALSFLPGLSDAWKGHLSKWPGISSRLLLLCHALEHHESEFVLIGATPVSADTARRAAKLVDYLLANSLRFYMELVGAGQATYDARWIAGYLLTRPNMTTITRNKIGDACKPLRTEYDRIRQAMQMLVHLQWVVPNTETRVDQRYGPTQWTICTDIHDGRFATYAEIETRQRREAQEKIAAASIERARIMGGHGVFD